MVDIVPVQLAVEDELSEVILKTILRQTGRPFEIGTCYRKRGNGYLKVKVQGFNNAAKGIPFILLTDLDRGSCAPELINDWLSVPKSPNFIFRVAVRAIESWLLAHKEAVGKLLGISPDKIPDDVDSIDKPKNFLIDLARGSRFSLIRDSIVPRPNTTAKVGRDYNGLLSGFVDRKWKVSVAANRSDSLSRAYKALCSFTPNWPRLGRKVS